MIHRLHSHDYKKNKYKDIGCCGSTAAGNRKIVPHFIEVSTLGFISDISDFTKALKISITPDKLKRSAVIAASKSSFSIHCNRNNAAMDAA